MTRLADIIEMDAKQEATRQNAKAIKALVALAEREIQIQETVLEAITEGRDATIIHMQKRIEELEADNGNTPRTNA